METALSDEALMEGYKAGDEKAFNALFARYENRLYNFFLRRFGDANTADDLYQTTWLKVHRNRNRFDPTKSFRVWLFTIAYNLLKDEYKRSAKIRETHSDELPEGKDPRVSPEIQLEQAEMKEIVRRALDTLPESQREILILSKYEGMSYSEIARITGLSVGAVKQKAHRGFLNLKSRLGAFVKEQQTI